MNSAFFKGFVFELTKASAPLPIASVSRIGPAVGPLKTQALQASRATSKILIRGTKGYQSPAG